jgi:hypothetical protein
MSRSVDAGRLIVLTNVLYVPSLGYNLCSGAQLNAKGAECMQTGSHLTISMASRKVVMRGDEVNNLYYLRCQLVPPGEREVHVSLATWHKKLGHPSMDTVLRMSTLGAVKGIGKIEDKPSKCDVCCAAKQQRTSHPRSDSRAARVWQLIHTDFMFPQEDGIDVESSSLVMTVLDDLSRYAEVIVLPSKGEASSVLRNVAARMEKQTGQRIRIIRFDRGTENDVESSSFVITVLDDFSRSAEVIVLPSKGAAYSVLRNVAARMEKQTGQRIRKIRFDRGTKNYQLKG